MISCLKEGEEPTRDDYCLHCWTEERGEGTSVWQARVVESKRENKKRFVDLFERGLELLDAYLEAEDTKAYMLALYLQRQGALHRLRARRTKKTIALFEVVETGKTVAVPINDPAPPGTIEQDLMQALTGDGA